MAAKKTDDEKAQEAEKQSATAPARAESVAPIEQTEPTPEKNPSDESVQTPNIDPSLSSDNQHSTYRPSSEEFPSDQGPQTEEVLGKPKG